MKTYLKTGWSILIMILLSGSLAAQIVLEPISPNWRDKGWTGHENSTSLSRSISSKGIEVIWFCPGPCSNINYGILVGGEIMNQSDEPQTVRVKIFRGADLILFASLGTIEIFTTDELDEDESDELVLQPGETKMFVVQYAAPEGEHTIKMEVRCGDEVLSKVCSTVVQDNPEADISIKKEVSDPNPTVGDTICYFLTVKNAGPNIAVECDLFEYIPEGLELISIDCAGTTFSESNGIGCRFGELEVGDSITIKVKVVVTAAGLIENRASVNTCSFDKNQEDNFAGIPIEAKGLPEADLKVFKAADRVNEFIGSSVLYRIFVINCGDSTARDIVLTDTLPTSISSPDRASAIFSDTKSIAGTCNVIGKNIHCDLRDLEKGDTIEVTYLSTQLQADPSATNIAVVTSSTPDPNLANNQSILELEILPFPDLEITKEFTHDSIFIGDTTTVTLTWRNLGADDALNVIIKDTLAPCYKLVGPLPDQCRLENGVIVCELAGISPGDGKTFDYKCLPLKQGKLTNKAHIEYDKEDPNPINNVDLDSICVISPIVIENICLDQFFYTSTWDTTADYSLVIKDNPPLREFLNVVICDGDFQEWVIENARTHYYTSFQGNDILDPISFRFSYFKNYIGGANNSDTVILKIITTDYPFDTIPEYFYVEKKVPVVKYKSEYYNSFLDHTEKFKFPDLSDPKRQFSRKLENINAIFYEDYIVIDLDSSLYNTSTDNPDIGGIYQGDYNASAPAAAASHFHWLSFKHEEVSLLFDEQRNHLVELGNLMNRPQNMGVFSRKFIEGKLDFINLNRLPIQIQYQSILDDLQEDILAVNSVSNHVAVNRNGGPNSHITWAFLKNEMMQGKAIEIFYDWWTRTDTASKGSNTAIVVGLSEENGQRKITIADDLDHTNSGGTNTRQLDWYEFDDDVFMMSGRKSELARRVVNIVSMGFDPSVTHPNATKNPSINQVDFVGFPSPLKRSQDLHLSVEVTEKSFLQFQLASIQGTILWEQKEEIILPGKYTTTLTLPATIAPGNYLMMVRNGSRIGTEVIQIID